jgi:hypothetical protein
MAGAYISVRDGDFKKLAGWGGTQKTGWVGQPSASDPFSCPSVHLLVPMESFFHQVQIARIE